MSRIRTLLQVLPDIPPGSSGAGWVVEGVSKAMEARGWRIERVTAEDVAPAKKGRTYLAVPLALACRAGRAAKALSADGPCVVECHGFWGGPATFSLRRRKLPNVVTLFRCHGFWRAAVALAAADDAGRAAPSPWRTLKSELTYGTLEKMGTRLSDVVIVQNSSDARFAELVDGVPRQRLLVLPPGVSSSPPHADIPRRERIRILWVGRRSLVKGSDLLPTIVRLLRERRVDVEIELIGHDPAEFPPGPSLIVRPHVPREEVSAAIARSDVFLWTSRYEGFGLAPFEAMALGRPVVSTQVGGMVDFLRDHENGVVVNEATPLTFVDAIVRFVSLAPDVRRKLGSNARLSVAGLTWERHAERLEQFLDPLLGTSSAPRRSTES